MIRFLFDKFRAAPGPLKEARLIVADLAEEILDLAAHYAEKMREPKGQWEDVDGSKKACERHPSAKPGPGKSATERPSIGEEPSEPSHPPTRSLEVDPRFATALGLPANNKTQEFKVLAILWDAKSRGMDNLSAKAVSEHGERLGVAIRHENVRKVIRTRLGAFVDVHTEKTGSATVYRYRISTEGESHFVSKYLR
ncbi:MAG: hypothetical protein PHU25_03720 [Deltaproteobacteria bacterium]|nr:hypothetical protein [Deltaproteobacteria bacterium]